MPKVVGVKFYKQGVETGKIYYFSINETEETLRVGFDLIVSTQKGEEVVKAVTEVKEISEDSVVTPLKPIVRIATAKDRKNHKNNIKDEPKVVETAKILAEDLNPEIQIIAAEYVLDRSQLLIYFVSEKRVDFRELVKELVSRYRTRIELRQVGVRDEAKVIGGIGMCGRVICCNTYLSSFETVSINMAKNQSLSLIPSKVSGICGRLLCCLRYEDEDYKILKKGLPKLGSKFETSDGVGKVVSHNVLLGSFKVYVKGKGLVDVDASSIK